MFTIAAIKLKKSLAINKPNKAKKQTMKSNHFLHQIKTLYLNVK